MRLTIAACLFLAAPAAAQDLEMINLANALATVLASEGPCGLAFDAGAIRAFIAENVPPESLDFASTLGGFTAAQGYAIEAQSASQRVAHCAAVELTARSYGFID